MDDAAARYPRRLCRCHKRLSCRSSSETSIDSGFNQEAHSVREFVELAFAKIGVTIAWEGSGVDEVGKDKATGVVRVTVSDKV